MKQCVRKLVEVVGILVTSGCIACGSGGGDSDSGSEIFPQFPGDTQVKNLTSREASIVCDDLRTVITDPGFKRDFCQVSAIAEASLLNENRVECEASVDDCVAQLHPTDCDFNDEGNRRGCNATIAELEDCVRDQRDQVQIQAAELSCDNIDAGAAALKEFDINSIPSCARLQTKCPTASI